MRVKGFTKLHGFRTAAVAVALELAALTTAFGQITKTQIGNPTWEPVDMHMFSAPLGTPKGSAYLQILNVFQKPKHVYLDAGGWVYPGLRHQPAYTGEVTAGMAANGYADPINWTFTPQDTKAPNGGLAFLFVIIPATGAETGSSPDFDSGPIILRTTQITGQNTLYENGTQTLQYPWTPVPSLNDDPAYAAFDGSSHIPWTSGLWADFNAGSYELHHVLQDQDGNGWEIVYSFQVVQSGHNK